MSSEREMAKSIVERIGPPSKLAKGKLMADPDDSDDDDSDDLETMHSDYHKAVTKGDHALAAKIFRQMRDVE